MNDDPGFVIHYPVFLIGQHSAEACEADPSLRQAWATTVAKKQSALLVFTEVRSVLRFMDLEKLTAFIVAIESPAKLADVIRRNRNHFSMVMIDSDPITRVGRGFAVDEFLSDLER
jgi:hypothetical protein